MEYSGLLNPHMKDHPPITPIALLCGQEVNLNPAEPQKWWHPPRTASSIRLTQAQTGARSIYQGKESKSSWYHWLAPEVFWNLPFPSTILSPPATETWLQTLKSLLVGSPLRGHSARHSHLTTGPGLFQLEANEHIFFSSELAAGCDKS